MANDPMKPWTDPDPEQMEQHAEAGRDEATAIREELVYFRTYLWPVYKFDGFTFAQAYQAWLTGRMADALEDVEEEGVEPWQESTDDEE